jgi:hypothetical protein
MKIAAKLRSTVLKMGFCFLLVIFVEPSLSSQEVEARGNGTSALFSPANYMEISTPLTARVGAILYGFYLGNVQAGIALIEVPTKLSNHLAVTPTYLFIKVPANGLALLTQEPQNVGYREHQFRLSATLSTSWRHFNFAERNMYARYFGFAITLLVLGCRCPALGQWTIWYMPTMESRLPAKVCDLTVRGGKWKS